MVKKDSDFFYIAIFVCTVFLDQITKYLVRTRMTVGQSVAVIENIFHITYAQNTGVAFGLLKGLNTIFIVVLIAAFVLAAYYFVNSKNKVIRNLVTLISAGIIGNLIDRLILGHVVDFIDFRIWPVFNIADATLTVCIIWLAVYLWKK